MGPRASQLWRLVGIDLTGAEGVDHSLSGWIGWFKLCQRAIKEMFDEEYLENKIILSHVNVTRRCSLLPLAVKGKQLAPAGSCGMVLSWRLTAVGHFCAQQGRVESQIQSGPCGITKLLGQTWPKRPFMPFSKQLGDGAAQWPLNRGNASGRKKWKKHVGQWHPWKQRGRTQNWAREAQIAMQIL